MLSHDQLRHFADHGWVLEENVLSPDQIEAYKAALERQSHYVRPLAHKDDDEIVHVDCMVNGDPIFREWLMIPQVLEANRQLMGAEIKYETCHAMIKRPHPDRRTQHDPLRDPDKMGWHRGLRPKWGTFPHDTDPDLINCVFLNNITYLTDVAPGDGGTMILDGSHRLEGTYETLKDQVPRRRGHGHSRQHPPLHRDPPPRRRAHPQRKRALYHVLRLHPQLVRQLARHRSPRLRPQNRAR